MLLSLLVFFFLHLGRVLENRLQDISTFVVALVGAASVVCATSNSAHTIPAEPPWKEDHAAPRDERLSLTAGAC